MDKMTFASYKFKPSDVIEGLNRYFAEAKAFRYRRVPLEIRNGEVKPGNYYVFRNIVFYVDVPKVKECGYYYLICYPEEVVGVAINWLREEHDIFYTPGMEAPKEDRDIFCMENLKETKNFSIVINDFYVDDAAKEYEQATRKDDVKYYSEKDLREALGVAEDSDIFQCIKYRNSQLEILRTEVAVARRRYNRANNDRSYFGKRLVDIRKAAGMADDDPTDLVKYVEALREKAAEQQKKIDSYEATLRKITDIMEPEHAGPAWSETWDDLVERIKRMKEKVEMLEAAKTDWRDSFEKAQDSRSAFCKKLKEALDVDYRYPGSFPKMEEDILAEIKRLKMKAAANDFHVESEWEADYRAFVQRIFEALGTPCVDEVIHPNYLALQALEAVEELKAGHDDARGLSLKIEELEEKLKFAKQAENWHIRTNRELTGLRQKLNDIKDICDGNSDVMNVIGK